MRRDTRTPAIPAGIGTSLPNTRMRPPKVVLLCAAAVTLLASCGDDRPPPTPEPAGTAGTSRVIYTTEGPATTGTTEPTATTEVTSTTTTEAASAPPAGDAEPPAPDNGGELEVDGDTTWHDVFDSLGPSEQACISEELGDDDLQSFLEQPVLWSRGVAGERALFPCLEPSEAGELLLAMMFAAIEEEGLTLGSEERACLRDQIGDIDWTTPGRTRLRRRLRGSGRSLIGVRDLRTGPADRRDGNSTRRPERRGASVPRGLDRGHPQRHADRLRPGRRSDRRRRS